MTNAGLIGLLAAGGVSAPLSWPPVRMAGCGGV